MNFAAVFTPSGLVALVALSVLEIVLGIDNIVFISIVAGRLPEEERKRARLTGLGLALVTRVGLLLSIGLISRLTYPVFTLPLDFAGFVPDAKAAREMAEVSWRDLILGGGGLFLIYKSVSEIHHKLEGEDDPDEENRHRARFWPTIGQILVLDVIFSLDSVITAVGMANEIAVMILAVMVAVVFMLVFSGKISAFVERHPTIKVLALSFLVLIGVNLLAESAGQSIPKGYTYFAMGFAVLVESLNLRLRPGPPRIVLVPDDPKNG